MNKPKRNPHRWFQLSLRSIFLLMLIVAAYFAGYRTAVRQAERAQAERDGRLQRAREMLARDLQACAPAVNPFTPTWGSMEIIEGKAP